MWLLLCCLGDQFRYQFCRQIVASKERQISAWIGGSVVAQLPSFQDQLVLAEDYDEEGPELIHKLNILSLSS